MQTTVRSGEQREETETLHVVVLEVGAEDGAAELADVGHHKAGRADGRSVGTRCGGHGHGQAGTHLVPSSVQLMNWEDFGSLIILWTYVIAVSERANGESTGRKRTPGRSEDMYNHELCPSWRKRFHGHGT